MQELINRLKENGHCNIVGWIDDDYWEYRRCCLDVDSVESITKSRFDYILIAAVDKQIARNTIRRLCDYGVSRNKILTVSVPDTKEKKEELLHQFIHI